MNYISIWKLTFSVSSILIYYYFGKKIMIFLSQRLVQNNIVSSSKIPIQDFNGIIELILIVLSHVTFCFSFGTATHYNVLNLFSLKDFDINQILLGLFLGIGQMGVSSSLCFLFIRFLQTFFRKRVPNTNIEWMSISRSGWLRHHFHTLNKLPFTLALLIITAQISSEEIVFRGIFLNQINQNNILIPIISSTILFALIQCFLMPSKLAKMFPVVGALVMGASNGYLYLHTQNLVPLIVAHIVFFILSTI